MSVFVGSSVEGEIVLIRRKRFKVENLFLLEGEFGCKEVNLEKKRIEKLDWQDFNFFVVIVMGTKCKQLIL